MYETQKWPFIQASQYGKWTKLGRRPVRLLVIHDMEFPERKDTAEVIAHDFATRTPANPGSAHICVDSDSIIQCVHDNDIAWAAPGANTDGIQVELAGYGKQTREDWLDVYGIALLALGCDASAQYLLKYGIPPLKLSVAQVKDGKTRGVCGHVDVTNAFPDLGHGHQDPGTHFPWDYFMSSVKAFYNVRSHS
jgi:N-acetyl-anhydromuramyl-L-alanine amidase AmpD